MQKKQIKFKDQELTIDLAAFAGETKSVIRNPRQFFAKFPKKTLLDTVVYFVLITIVGAFLSFIVAALLANPKPTLPDVLTQFVYSIVLVTVSSFAWVGILHGWIRLFKGTALYKETYAVFSYSRAPISLFGWIPYVGILASLYTFYLMVIGVHTFHKFTLKKALLVLVPLFIIVIVVQVIFFAILSSATPS